MDANRITVCESVCTSDVVTDRHTNDWPITCADCVTYGIADVSAYCCTDGGSYGRAHTGSDWCSVSCAYTSAYIRSFAGADGNTVSCSDAQADDSTDGCADTSTSLRSRHASV